MRLLIVDDELKLTDLLKRRFGARGHEVLTTGNGEEAITLLTTQPHLILLDLSLQGKLTGRDVLQEARRRVPTTPVIVVTGFVEAQAEEFTQLGASGLLKKPIQLEELDALIQRFGTQETPEKS